MSICIIHLSDGKVAGVYSNTHEPMEVMVMERDGPRMTEEQQARYRAFQTMVKYGLVMDWQNPPYTLPPELSYFIDQLAEEIVLSETIPTCRLCSIGECQSQVGGLVCRNAVKAWLLERAKRYLCPKAEAKTGDKRE